MDRERSPQNTAIRGVVLLVVVAAIGAIIVNKGFSNDGGQVTAEDPANTTTTIVSTIPDGGVTSSSSTTSSTLPVSTTAIRVIVANGQTGVDGAARGLGIVLKAAGHTVLAPTNSNKADGKIPTTKVYYVEGKQALGDQIAQVIKSDSVTPPVELMPAVPPITKAALGDAEVLILLGTDLAKPA